MVRRGMRDILVLPQFMRDGGYPKVWAATQESEGLVKFQPCETVSAVMH
jgi:hypothetical protein